MSDNTSFEFMSEEDISLLGIPGSTADSLTDHGTDAGAEDEEAELDDSDQQIIDDHTYNQAPLSYELQQGLRILKELMSDSNRSVNWHFLNPVDNSHPETADYYEKIKKPIWLGKMKEKFEFREYASITQFVADFRQMLENCYRFNGPDHFVSRRAQKLETMMEQKLNLLSRELREKTSITATSGHLKDDHPLSISGIRRRARAIIPHDSTALLNQLRVEEQLKGREARRQQMIERKAVLESHIQGMMEWEDKLMEGHREDVKAMWELPSIGLFLFLCHYPLNIGEVPQFELERCLFMVKESSTLQRIMTTLLSTPFQRHKLDKTGMMPYRVWNEKLRERMAPWFKVYKDSKDVYKVADKFGIDPFLFQVVGKKNPMRKKKFHELSLYQKVWVLKSLCDNCVESQESLVKTIESQYPEEQKEYKLGEDAEGNTYIHFPQFCGVDVRIYRQSYIPEPQFDEQGMDEEMKEEKEPVKSTTKRKPDKKDKGERSRNREGTPTPKKKVKKMKTFTSEIPVPPSNRPSRLRQTIKTVLPVSANDEGTTEEEELDSTENEDTQSESESEETESCNDSVQDNNTPFKNYLRNKVFDDFSENSSLDSLNDIWSVKRTRSGKIRYNIAIGFGHDFSNLTYSESSNQGSVQNSKSRSKKGIEKRRTDFQGLNLGKNSNGVSDIDSDSCNNKNDNEKGDGKDTVISNSESYSKCDEELDTKQNEHILQPSCDTTDKCLKKDKMKKVNENSYVEDINEDSSTSNDFSEVDNQDNTLDSSHGNTAEVETSDKEMLSRIFASSNDNLFDNDSDTNSSFRFKVNKSPSELSSNASRSNNEKVKETSEQEVIVREVTPSRDLSDGTDTDTEFNDRMEVNTSDNFVSQNHIVKSESDQGTAKDNIVKRREKISESDELMEDQETNIKEEIVVGSSLDVEADLSDMQHQTVSSDIKQEVTDDAASRSEVKDLFDTVSCSMSQICPPLSPRNFVNNSDNDKHSNETEGEITNVNVKKENNNVTENKEAILEKVKDAEGEVKVKEEVEEEDKVKEELEGEEKVKNEAMEGEEVKHEAEGEEKVKEEIESDDEEDDTELVTGPEIGAFELVAESVEDLRNLVEKFAEPDPSASTRSKKSRSSKQSTRKKCVVQLHNRLTYLLKELEPWEQKLVQATKKNRLKMKKEHQSFDHFKAEDGWESDHSESTNSATEDNGMEVEGSPSKTRQQSVPKDSQGEDSKNAEDGEWDISLRGRIRKRRIIPNNVEDQGLSKKRRVETTPDPSDSNFDQVKGQEPGHLLLHTSGGQTYYTGINNQSLNSLRMLSQTKQAAHPIIQQLLQQPGMSSSRPLVNTSVSTTQASRTGKKVVTPNPRPTTPSSKGTQPSGKVQYFAANINSLPPAVVQQLIKSNALTIQPGNSPQGMILLTAVNPDVGGTSGTKATLTLQNPVGVKIPSTLQIPVSTVAVASSVVATPSVVSVASTVVSKAGPSDGNEIQASLSAKIPVTSQSVASPQQTPFVKVCMGMSMPSVNQQQTTTSSHVIKSTVNNIPKRGATPKATTSVAQTTAQRTVLQQNPSVLTSVSQGITLQNASRLNIVNQGGYVLNSGQVQGLQMNPTLNIGAQGTISINPQGLTLQQIQALALQGISIQGVSLQGSNLVVQPNANLRLQNPVNLQGQVIGSTAPASNTHNTVVRPQNVTQTQVMQNSDAMRKGLLIVSTENVTNICPPISPNVGKIHTAFVTSGNDITETTSSALGLQISPGRQQCKYASNVTVKTLLEARKPSISEPLSPSTSSDHQGTIVVQSTATGIKKLKLPSKAALDSAIQTVVTEVITSLPTANIKVPSPVTMPSIQPRRNITKTIQSMKVPIPTTPKVEAKSSGPISLQVSAPNIVSPMSPVIGQPNLAMASPGIMQLNNSGGQIMLTNLKPNQSVPAGQNVVQGYLTPQGLIIPSANLKNLQFQQKVVSSVAQTNSQPSDSVAKQQSVVTMPETTNFMNTTNSADLKLVQEFSSNKVAMVNASNLTGSPLTTHKTLALPLAGSNSGNLMYISPSTNIQSGSQLVQNQQLTPIVLNQQTNNLEQPITPIMLNTQQNIIGNINKSNAECSERKTIVSLPLGLPKIETKQTVSTTKPDFVSNTVSSPATGKMKLQDGSSVSNQKLCQSSSNNATLLSHLNSPALKTNVNHFALPTEAGGSGSSQNKISDQQQMNKAGLNQQQIRNPYIPINQQTTHKQVIKTEGASSQSMTTTKASPALTKMHVVSSPLVKQGPILANPLIKQGPVSTETNKKPAPIIINQQGSSSEIIKQLAALGTSGQQQTLTLANGNKLIVQMPSGQLPADGKMVLQLPSQLTGETVKLNQSLKLAQPTTLAAAVGQNNSNSVSSKVMMQLPGQAQAGSPMVFVSPNKQFILGSQALQSPLLGNVIQSGDQNILYKSVQGNIIANKSSAVETINNSSNGSDLISNSTSAGLVKMGGGIGLKDQLGQPLKQVKTSDVQNLKDKGDNIFKFPNVSLNVASNQPALQNSQALTNLTKQQEASATTMTAQNSVSSQQNVKGSGTPQKLFLYNINGQLVTAQGVPVTVDNGILKILPQPKVQMSNFNLPKSPPAGTKTQNVPISPKPGQSTVNPQQAYLNVLTSPNNAGKQVANQSPASGAVKLGTVQTGPKKTIPVQTGLNQTKSVVRNLNAALTVPGGVLANATAVVDAKTNLVMPTQMGDGSHVRPRFVVMPETGEQTQIVFPQPNIHSSHLNNVQSASISSSIPLLKISAPLSGNSPLVHNSLDQNSSSAILNMIQPIKINNTSQKESGANVLSTTVLNVNGNHVLVTGTQLNSNGTSSNPGDAQEAALNLLSLANLRFST